jgi:hypothetical protein
VYLKDLKTDPSENQIDYDEPVIETMRGAMACIAHLRDRVEVLESIVHRLLSKGTPVYVIERNGAWSERDPK